MIGAKRQTRSTPLPTGPWRGHRQIGHLGSLRPTKGIDRSSVKAGLEKLQRAGYREVVTSALRWDELHPYLDAGFEPRERLTLLRHDLHNLPGPDRGIAHRRSRRRDSSAVLDVDHTAFLPFWRLDRASMREAISATPSARFRIATHTKTRPARAAAEAGPVSRRDRDDVLGYAITGLAGNVGYLQRLAVQPGLQGLGLGSELIHDGLRWLGRRRARSCLVNTQESNTGAISLYERLGFRPEHEWLTILTFDLAGC